MTLSYPMIESLRAGAGLVWDVVVAGAFFVAVPDLGRVALPLPDACEPVAAGATLPVSGLPVTAGVAAGGVAAAVSAAPD